MKMTEFLVKHFVKNYEKVSDVEVRTAYGILASFVGIGCNLILFAAKLAVGLVINSISVMADAFNNLFFHHRFCWSENGGKAGR